jgi:leader peptidase (prepilin peptidase)/N-methyltransferase
LAHAAWKLLKYVKKRIRGGQLSDADREIPLGPYLSMAATILLFLWPWLWPVCDRGLFNPLYVIFWWLLGINA